MSNMKIIDDLSKEEILVLETLDFCTNPVRESDNWHTKNEMANDPATHKISRDQAIDSEYQVFALVDDGRYEGAVWFPVTVTVGEYK